MPVGPHSRRAFDMRDLLPGRAQALTQFRQQLARERDFQRGGDFAIYSAEVVRANGFDRYVFRSPSSPSFEFEAPVAPGVRYSPGEKATLAQTRNGSVAVAGAVAGEKGKSERPSANRSRSLDILILQAADPDELALGATESVTFTGVGFSDDPVDIIEAVTPHPTLPDEEWELRADVTVGLVSYVSATQVTADVTRDAVPPVVTESADVLERIWFRPRRG